MGCSSSKDGLENIDDSLQVGFRSIRKEHKWREGYHSEPPRKHPSVRMKKDRPSETDTEKEADHVSAPDPLRTEEEQRCVRSSETNMGKEVDNESAPVLLHLEEKQCCVQE